MGAPRLPYLLVQLLEQEAGYLSSKTNLTSTTKWSAKNVSPFVSSQINHSNLNFTDSLLKGPGTSPTSVSTNSAFLYAPLVYVDYKPQDPSKEYQARGMTLIAIDAPDSGPIAIRQGDLIIPGTEVPFGGFSSLMGFKSTDPMTDNDEGDRDIYLLGITDAGLQLARAGINDLNVFAKYTFWNPKIQRFSKEPPKPAISDTAQIYLPGSFSSGSLFYSPYFANFVMVYFNKMVDSTFYMRYLQLNEPLGQDKTWPAGGKNGKGVVAEDVEALVKYLWSDEQKLYESPTGKGGFNYAGNAHPEYFNTQYFPQSLYPKGTKPSQQLNDWYGSDVVPRKDGGGDGKNLLLSWTSQLVGGLDNGIYQIELAVLTFDDIPPSPQTDVSPSTTSSTRAAAPSAIETNPQTPQHIPVGAVFAFVEKGMGVRARSAVYPWGYLFMALSLLHVMLLDGWLL